MNKQVNYYLVIFCGAVLSAACGSSSPTNTGTGGSGGSGGGGGGGGGVPSGSGVVLVPDATGFVDKAAAGNTVGIQGAWYAYGDALGDNGIAPGHCQSIGMHTDAECSKITDPLPGMGFPNTGGKMCTTGTVEAVLTLNAAMDFDNMFGAGIGLDFNNPGMAGGTVVVPKAPFDMDAANVKGVSFDIDQVPPAKLRVEFPDVATNNKAAAYWLTTAGTYAPSPVMPGHNVIMWADVKTPAATVPALNTKAMMGIQFHVPSGSAGPYTFCISNLTLLQ